MNGQERIEALFAFVVIDTDGTEGIAGFTAPSGLFMPMVGADIARVEHLMPIAQQIADGLGRGMEIVHFTTRVSAGTITPRKAGAR